jgi:hypothetical protein
MEYRGCAMKFILALFLTLSAPAVSLAGPCPATGCSTQLGEYIFAIRVESTSPYFAVNKHYKNTIWADNVKDADFENRCRWISVQPNLLVTYKQPSPECVELAASQALTFDPGAQVTLEEKDDAGKAWTITDFRTGKVTIQQLIPEKR